MFPANLSLSSYSPKLWDFEQDIITVTGKSVCISGTQSCLNLTFTLGFGEGKTIYTSNTLTIHLPSARCILSPFTEGGCGDRSPGLVSFFIADWAKEHGVSWAFLAGNRLQRNLCGMAQSNLVEQTQCTGLILKETSFTNQTQHETLGEKRSPSAFLSSFLSLPRLYIKSIPLETKLQLRIKRGMD